MAEKMQYSLRARLELAAYNGLAGVTALFGAATLPLLRTCFSRIDAGFTDYLGLLPRPQPQRRSLWVHGVSMGESLVAIAFAAELKRLFPEYFLLFTSTHPDVINNMKKRHIADAVAYFPLDTPVTMQRAFNRVRPSAVFVAETDFWPNFSHQCRCRNIPLLLINGRISSKIADFYGRGAGLAEVVFAAFREFIVQGRADAQRLLQIGVPAEKITVAGNIKADLTCISENVDLSEISAWKGQRQLVVFGSLHPGEFALLQPVISQLAAAKTAVLLAPRNLKFADEWRQQLDKIGISTVLRSEKKHEAAQIMILDSMGELAAVYGLADAAIVGGSIVDGVGGHNPLEVMQQQVPLLMGPYYRNFADIVEQLEEEQAVRICTDAKAFSRALQEILETSQTEMVAAATRVLQKNRGALNFTLAKARRIIGLASEKEAPGF